MFFLSIPNGIEGTPTHLPDLSHAGGEHILHDKRKWVPALRCTAEEALHRVRDT